MSTCSAPALHFIFFFNDTATTEIYTLSLHDALPISTPCDEDVGFDSYFHFTGAPGRSEEHTSELQSRRDLVCRLLLEKKKKKPRAQPSELCHCSSTSQRINTVVSWLRTLQPRHPDTF